MTPVRDDSSADRAIASTPAGPASVADPGGGPACAPIGFGSGIRTEAVTVGQLVRFAEHEIGRAAPGQFVPITMQRARAQARNPYASADDVALLVARDGAGETVAYLGIMPVLLRRGTDRFKVHCLTTWNVSPTVRGQRVGSGLLEEAIGLGCECFAIGSAPARRVFARRGFWERPPFQYWRLLRVPPDDTRHRSRLRRLWNRVSRIARRGRPDRLAGLDGLDLPANRTERRRSPGVKWLELETRLLDGLAVRAVPRVGRVPEAHPVDPAVVFHRGIDAINWMLEWPWVIEQGPSPTSGLSYYFSDVRPLFRYQALEVEDATGRFLGVAVFSLSARHRRVVLKTLDCGFVEPARREIALGLALRLARLASAEVIDLPDDLAAPLARCALGTYRLERQERVCHALPASSNSPLASLWPEISFRLTDGDMAFT